LGVGVTLPKLLEVNDEEEDEETFESVPKLRLFSFDETVVEADGGGKF